VLKSGELANFALHRPAVKLRVPGHSVAICASRRTAARELSRTLGPEEFSVLWLRSADAEAPGRADLSPFTSLIDEQTKQSRSPPSRRYLKVN
jgi:hypothetical protein